MKRHHIIIPCCLAAILLSGGCKTKEYIVPADQNSKLQNEERKDLKPTLSAETENLSVNDLKKAPEPESRKTEQQVSAYTGIKDYSDDVSNQEEFSESVVIPENREAYVSEENALEIIISGDIEDRILVNDSLALITSVEKLYWLDQDRLVIIANIIPPLQCLMVYDLKEKKTESEKYGTGFSWKASDITTLIYIVPGAYFSKKGNLEIIKDYQDRIIYQAPKGYTISDLQWESGDKIRFQLNDGDGRATKKVIECQ